MVSGLSAAPPLSATESFLSESSFGHAFAINSQAREGKKAECTAKTTIGQEDRGWERLLSGEKAFAVLLENDFFEPDEKKFSCSRFGDRILPSGLGRPCTSPASRGGGARIPLARRVVRRGGLSVSGCRRRRSQADPNDCQSY